MKTNYKSTFSIIGFIVLLAAIVIDAIYVYNVPAFLLTGFNMAVIAGFFAPFFLFLSDKPKRQKNIVLQMLFNVVIAGIYIVSIAWFLHANPLTEIMDPLKCTFIVIGAGCFAFLMSFLIFVASFYTDAVVEKVKGK
ncbi:hypothetical protein MsAg5_12810 [Methanosarcinaceae archaeon Ag5]|uniref:Uncharacterized protein n=1 Tax=Methanolapillus africanus TaxID=3028297 RepID=A0AAE4MLT3_9EURY|nr:hypothetical protein [Methanosarcinaceae archaeon Ag5]